jgi:hypothetical protein
MLLKRKSGSKIPLYHSICSKKGSIQDNFLAPNVDNNQN